MNKKKKKKNTCAKELAQCQNTIRALEIRLSLADARDDILLSTVNNIWDRIIEYRNTPEWNVCLEHVCISIDTAMDIYLGAINHALDSYAEKKGQS